jgi:hypothetical protein
MKLVTYSCDCESCKFATQDKKAMITYIKYTVKSAGKKTKAVKNEEHFCSEECLRKAKGYKEITVQK